MDLFFQCENSVHCFFFRERIVFAVGMQQGCEMLFVTEFSDSQA